ncbi:uncharacterized protein BO87DRAFT_375683 [Aspergillus neoniger CBS 115656]|uniref:Uncharacterized protein n=1 Tax=Aspergillus neoniger (strain CBS 115656) TaxID=1448310 RepID=A0A318YRX0_ASPNB|nr:hypothetical protein BO87DRAFT_375683 [Aspergillus neoniger CBS 115656]PYH35503.1 hypothetical protein BO87DRAFT_375683 [Aspergillus neoniger CBS 115656]
MYRHCRLLISIASFRSLCSFDETGVMSIWDGLHGFALSAAKVDICKPLSKPSVPDKGAEGGERTREWPCTRDPFGDHRSSCMAEDPAIHSCRPNTQQESYAQTRHKPITPH